MTTLTESIENRINTHATEGGDMSELIDSGLLRPAIDPLCAEANWYTNDDKMKALKLMQNACGVSIFGLVLSCLDYCNRELHKSIKVIDVVMGLSNLLDENHAQNHSERNDEKSRLRLSFMQGCIYVDGLKLADAILAISPGWASYLPMKDSGADVLKAGELTGIANDKLVYQLPEQHMADSDFLEHLQRFLRSAIENNISSLAISVCRDIKPEVISTNWTWKDLDHQRCVLAVKKTIEYIDKYSDGKTIQTVAFISADDSFLNIANSYS